MSERDCGGPAFPIHPDMPGRLGCIPSQSDAGMTLRDYFAAAALQGWLATYGIEARHPACSSEAVADLAMRSYAIADAMLEEREKL